MSYLTTIVGNVLCTAPIDTFSLYHCILRTDTNTYELSGMSSQALAYPANVPATRQESQVQTLLFFLVTFSIWYITKPPQQGRMKKALFRMLYNLTIGTSSPAYIHLLMLQRVGFNRTELSPFQSTRALTYEAAVRETPIPLL